MKKTLLNLIIGITANLNNRGRLQLKNFIKLMKTGIN